MRFSEAPKVDGAGSLRRLKNPMAGAFPTSLIDLPSVEQTAG